MIKEAYNDNKRRFGIGLSVMTVISAASISAFSPSICTNTDNPYNYVSISNYNDGYGMLSSSSSPSEKTDGSFMTCRQMPIKSATNKRISVMMKIGNVKKHKSNFEFEDEYEVI